MADPKQTSGIPMPDAVAGNFQDAMRWFNQMWSSGMDASTAARGPGGSIPSMVMPTLDVKELDKRIADLRSVEHWLNLNLNLLRTTIQGLDMQRNALSAWQSFAAPGASGAPAGGAGTTVPENPAFQAAAWWGALQQQFAQMAAAAATQPAGKGDADPAAPDAPDAPTKTPGAKGRSAGPAKP